MDIILVTLVGLICGMGSVLDERQTHRPLVACTLIGLVLGDLKTGVMVGGTLELVALGWRRMRRSPASSPPFSSSRADNRRRTASPSPFLLPSQDKC